MLSLLHLSGARLEILLKAKACTRGVCIKPFLQAGHCAKGSQALMRSAVTTAL